MVAETERPGEIRASALCGSLRSTEQVEDPVTGFAGTLPSPEGYLEKLRDEWNRDDPVGDLWGSEPG